MRLSVQCPVCRTGKSVAHAVIAGHGYFACRLCGSLHIDPATIAEIDAGRARLGEYAAEYWEQEKVGALERAEGIALCRAGEAILYCRRPVRAFLDVGAGP